MGNSDLQYVHMYLFASKVTNVEPHELHDSCITFSTSKIIPFRIFVYCYNRPKVHFLKFNKLNILITLRIIMSL
jgi:hypothetical protein